MPARRLLALLLASGVALAVLVLPAAAQTAPPSITVSPTQDAAGSSGTWSIQVRGQNFSDRAGVSIQFAGQAMTTVAPANGSFLVTINPARRFAGTYQVDATQNPCSPRVAPCPSTYSTSFRAVPQSTFNDPCGPVGSTVSLTVTGLNFPPKSFGNVVYDVEGPDQTTQSRIPTNSGTFSATFSVRVQSRAVTIQVYDVNQNQAPDLVWKASACPPGPTTTTTSTPTTTTTAGPTTTARVITTTTRPGLPGTTTTTLPPTIDVPPPTPGATLVVEPPLGPTGFVTTATGTGFPPGPVVLQWSGGIGGATTIAGPDGVFRVSVLVFPRDRRGPRALVATGGPVSSYAAFLVVPSSIEPSSGSRVAQITRSRRFLQR